MRFGNARRSLSAAVAVAVLLGILASCSPSTTSPPEATPAPVTSAPTATPEEACADIAALKSSLEALTEVRPLQDGAGALNTAIDNVRTALDKAEGSASEALQPSLQQVKTAFEGLQTAANGLTSDNLKEKAPAIGAALRQLGTATKALASTLRERCPGT